MTIAFTVDLTLEERDFLYRAILVWGGGTHPSEELLVAMGFSGKENLYSEKKSLAIRVQSGADLSEEDWKTALMAAAIGFADGIQGAGVYDWSILTGMEDNDGLRWLRSVQAKHLTAWATAKGAEGGDKRGHLRSAEPRRRVGEEPSEVRE